MIQCHLTHKHFHSAIDEVEARIKNKLLSPEKLDKYHARIEQLRNSFNPDQYDYSFHRLINAELDCKSPGDRGMGRTGSDVPRLGAYLRSGLEQLNNEQMQELYILIQDIMLKAYISAAWTIEAQPSKSISPEKLFLAWIPRIYMASPEDIFGFIELVFFFCEDAINAFLKKLYSYNMIDSPDHETMNQVLRMILTYYMVAGVGLRETELDPPDETDLSQHDMDLLKSTEKQLGGTGCLVVVLVLATATILSLL